MRRYTGDLGRTEAEVMDTLEGQQWCTVRYVCEDVGLGARHGRLVLQRLYKKGLVCRRTAEGWATKAEYRLGRVGERTLRDYWKTHVR